MWTAFWIRFNVNHTGDPASIKERPASLSVNPSIHPMRNRPVAPILEKGTKGYAYRYSSVPASFLKPKAWIRPQSHRLLDYIPVSAGNAPSLIAMGSDEFKQATSSRHSTMRRQV